MDDLYPLLVYEYNKEGRYSTPIRLADEAALLTWFEQNLKKILFERRELRITDLGDDLCFHAVGGDIVYDGVEHFPRGKYGGKLAGPKEAA